MQTLFKVKGLGFKAGGMYGLADEVAAPAEPTSLWQSIKNISGQLTSVGVTAAPALIAQAIAKKTAEKKPKKAKVAAPAVVPGQPPTPPAKKGLPGWVLPVAIGGGVLLLGGLFLKSRKS